MSRQIGLDDHAYDFTPIPVAPEPVEDCAECARLDRARHAARAARDRSAVSDCNVLMRIHQSAAHPQPL